MRASIRLAQPEDVFAMHKIRVSVRENRLSHPKIISEAAYLPFIADRACWIAHVENRAAGFTALDFKEGAVWALFVSPEMEGHGIGRALLQTLISAAASRNLKNMRLATEAGSRAAHFYVAAGWQYLGQADTLSEDIYELRLTDIETEYPEELPKKI